MCAGRRPFSRKQISHGAELNAQHWMMLAHRRQAHRQLAALPVYNQFPAARPLPDLLQQHVDAIDPTTIDADDNVFRPQAHASRQ